MGDISIKNIEICRQDIVKLASDSYGMKDITISDISLLLCISSEIHNIKVGELDLNEIAIACNEGITDTVLVDNLTDLFTVCTKYMFDLDDYRDLRNLRTPEDLDNHLIHLKDCLYETVSNVETELKYGLLKNERAIIYFMWSCILSKDLRSYIIEPALENFESVWFALEKTEEADFLDKGQPVLKPLENRKVLNELFSKRKIDIIEEVNERFKRSFISQTNNYSMNKEESRLVEELRDYMLFKVARRRTSVGDVDLFKDELIKVHEDKMIAILKDVSSLQNNVSLALQDANTEILSNLNLEDGIVFNDITVTYQRYLAEHTESLLGYIMEIQHTNKSLNNILVKFELNSSKANSDKLAMLRSGRTSREVEYWISTLLNDYRSTLIFYGDFCKDEILNRYKEFNEKEDLPQDGLDKLLATSSRRLNKTFKNIPSYRKLNKLAKEKGYTKIRDNGDHGIFRQHDGSTVVIPQGRSVGKGLSIRIQKDVCGKVLE